MSEEWQLECNHKTIGKNVLVHHSKTKKDRCDAIHPLQKGYIIDKPAFL